MSAQQLNNIDNSSEVKEIHGWYSPTQFNNINKHSETTDPRGYKYLYYTNLNDEVVEVTSVTNSKNHGTKFNDMHYVGMLKKFHKIEYK
jgi:hypothetical protein